MTDLSYVEAVEERRRRMNRGEADDLLYAAYVNGRTSAAEYIAYLRDELRDAWREVAELELDRDRPGWREEF